MFRARGSPLFYALAAAAITVYAALLRVDAHVAKHGSLQEPAWARILTTTGAPVGMRLRPFDQGWPPEPRPYVGGDPINYIKYAREMTGFYQAHVREPLFLAITRAFLWLLGGQDAAVSFASAVGSILAVLGTYLLAARLAPTWAALAAALLVAVDRDLITWAVDGWRDDLVMATVVWTSWAALRLRDVPSFGNGVLLGVCGAAACLTRITAAVFILPALAWLLADAPRDLRRQRLRPVAVAAAVLALLVAPYLINCARTYGDPLYAINYHTVYYRHWEGMPDQGSMSAAEYIRAKFAARPIATIDTGVTGLVVRPFATKWGGLEPVFGAAHRAIIWLSVFGLLMLPWSPPGRLLLVVLLTSLTPYAFTWNIGDGGAWRFTMHAYPLYIVAAAFAAVRIARAAAALLRDRRRLGRPSPRTIALAGIVGTLIIAAPVAYAALPWLVVREALGRGEDVNLDTGGRDAVFYARGWSAAQRDAITFRVSKGERSLVRVPLPRPGAYEIALRVDPVRPDAPQRLSVLFNGHFVARFALTLDPQRVGSYRFRLQPSQVRAGANALVLIPEPLVTASSAGPRFAGLPPDARIGVRLWYVRILPLRDGPEAPL